MSKKLLPSLAFLMALQQACSWPWPSITVEYAHFSDNALDKAIVPNDYSGMSESAWMRATEKRARNNLQELIPGSASVSDVEQYLEDIGASCSGTRGQVLGERVCTYQQWWTTTLMAGLRKSQIVRRDLELRIVVYEQASNSWELQLASNLITSFH